VRTYLGCTSIDPSLKSSLASSLQYPLVTSSLIALVALVTPSAVPVTVMTMGAVESLSTLGVLISTPVASGGRERREREGRKRGGRVRGENEWGTGRGEEVDRVQ
jgi:hypothetical protein